MVKRTGKSITRKSKAERRQRAEDAMKARAEKKSEAKIRRRERKEAEKNGETVERQTPDTVESKRELDDDIVDENDAEFEEVIEAEADDEFADYFNGERTPKILMTTIIKPSRQLLAFLKELQVVFPESYYVDRAKYEEADALLEFANERNFTDLMIFECRNNRPYGLFISHLPEGPTFHFRLSGVTLAEELGNAVKSSTHCPELVMKNFNTAMGRRIQRQMHALFPLDPEFTGRRCIAMINKHDFIFFRHYRYIFRAEGTKAGLAEIGPRFTLKLRSIQRGSLDRECGVYEYHWKPKHQERRTQHYI